MHYDIKMVGDSEDAGQIEFDRLVALTKSTKDIATKALMLQLRGYSDIAPDKQLKKALQMHLTAIAGNDQDGTALTINCKHFSATITGLQYDMFKPREDMLRLTPMALVIQSFHAALDNNATQTADVDKPLLKSLMNFRKNFITDNEIIYLANRGTVAEVKLTRADFKKIEVLEDSIPEPQNVIVNGLLDEMKISKGRLGLMTAEGMVNLIATEETAMQQLVDFMGKDITIKGKAHYKPNGLLSFVEISEYEVPSTGDHYFSIIPTAVSATQQVMFQMKDPKKSKSMAALMALSGILKEEINDDQMQEMLKDIHR